MALKLLYERQLGKESRLAHYVENLPGSFSSPLTWTDAELAGLQYPFLPQEVCATIGPYLYLLCVSHSAAPLSAPLPQQLTATFAKAEAQPSSIFTACCQRMDDMGISHHACAGEEDEGRTEAAAC